MTINLILAWIFTGLSIFCAGVGVGMILQMRIDDRAFKEWYLKRKEEEINDTKAKEAGSESNSQQHDDQTQTLWDEI